MSLGLFVILCQTLSYNVIICAFNLFLSWLFQIQMTNLSILIYFTTLPWNTHGNLYCCFLLLLLFFWGGGGSYSQFEAQSSQTLLHLKCRTIHADTCWNHSAAFVCCQIISDPVPSEVLFRFSTSKCFTDDARCCASWVISLYFTLFSCIFCYTCVIQVKFGFICFRDAVY